MDRCVAVQFLRTCLGRDGWIALLLKNVDSGGSVQRTGSRAWACQDSLLDWLVAKNAARYDVYVSVNTLAVGSHSRTRLDVAGVRHVFLDLDQDAPGVLRQLDRRSELPAPSYVVHTSPKRAHLLWRVRDFNTSSAERLQKQLAADLDGDPAATAATQLTRLPGFLNHKYREPFLVCVEYRDVERAYSPDDFPSVDRLESTRSEPAAARSVRRRRDRLERAVAYLSQVPPAIAGHHGDLHTFQMCCRVARGFALDDDQALAVLAEWNARCQPPWTERELLQKIRSARRNGREPIGGLL